jgi:predicted nucleotidyltransferase component of viral defense system
MRELAAWREHAPWPSDRQVEQDLLLTRAMAAIFSDSFLAGQVAMRGGTVLHKVHLAPAARYSEDIDLVLVGERPEGHVKRALRRVLTPILGEPHSSATQDLRQRARNLMMPSRVIRQEYRYAPTVGGSSEMRIKIEVNCNEREPFFEIVDLDYPLPPVVGDRETVTLRSYDLDEMLGTKMRALLQRDQGRDLFDLWWAITPSRPESADLVQPPRVIAAFTDYMAREGNAVTLGVYDDGLRRKLEKRSFRDDVASMLRPGLPLYDAEDAAALVRERLLSLLPSA